MYDRVEYLDGDRHYTVFFKKQEKTRRKSNIQSKCKGHTEEVAKKKEKRDSKTLGNEWKTRLKDKNKVASDRIQKTKKNC